MSSKDYNFILKKPFLLLLIILIFGLILRLFLTPYFTWEGDYHAWKGWADAIVRDGFSQFYSRNWCDYMPGYLYVLWMLEKLKVIFPNIDEVLLFKLPANLADFGISVVIFLSLKKVTTERNSLIASIVYFFNPASISNSTLWGQVDSFHALPILLSILFVLNNRFFLSGIFAMTAFMIKPQSIVIFPVLLLVLSKYVWGKGESISVLKKVLPFFYFVIAGLIIVYLFTYPFVKADVLSVYDFIASPFFLIKERFDAAYEQYKFASLNAFNFWGSFAMWKGDSSLFLGITYKNWGTVMFGLVYSALFGFLLFNSYYKNYTDKKEFSYVIFEVLTLVFFGLFLFVTRVHERHLLPTIVFFSLIAFRSLYFWLLYAIISIVYVINMYYSLLQLKTSYEAFSRITLQIMAPILFLILFVIFVVILYDFIRNNLLISRKSHIPINPRR